MHTSGSNTYSNRTLQKDWASQWTVQKINQSLGVACLNWNSDKNQFGMSDNKKNVEPNEESLKYRHIMPFFHNKESWKTSLKTHSYWHTVHCTVLRFLHTLFSQWVMNLSIELYSQVNQIDYLYTRKQVKGLQSAGHKIVDVYFFLLLTAV